MKPYFLHLTKKEYNNPWLIIKDYLHQDQDNDELYKAMRETLKQLLQSTMQIELNGLIKAAPYQRTPARTTHRNGYYHRNLLTKFGLLWNLEVPRPRQGGLKTKVFKRYQRRWQEVNQFIRDIFIAGVSTRQAGLVLEKLLDSKPSAGVISEICKILDDEVKKFQCRPLTDDYLYLFLDGVWVKVNNGQRVVKKVLLIAYGIKATGQREIIGFRQARSESAVEWEVFLWDLFHRGLSGERLRLIIVDGGKGLLSAVSLVYPHVARQRCWVHKLRNVSKRLKAVYRDKCIGEARKVYLAENYKEACARFRAWVRRWKGLAPEAVRCVEEDIEELLNYFKEAEWLRKKLRTTNVIERVF
ncbi:MAG: IS256 family transposase, partial [candidate division WOR-3 bacterium]|nr:IS256 family transposase [candidate division WOR-3 bacterium]